MNLATAADQPLLLAKDIFKLELKSEDGGGTGDFAICSRWRDHKAKVPYRLISDGDAKG